MKLILAIAAGGAAGAVARHYVGVLAGTLLGHGFPWGTLAVNVIGCFVMGALVELSALVWSPGPGLRALITVGFLGAFTTFSTFSLDLAVLHGRGESGLAVSYVIASVCLSVLALFGAMSLVRAVVQ